MTTYIDLDLNPPDAGLHPIEAELYRRDWTTTGTRSFRNSFVGKYGITLETYIEMGRSQGWVCAICGLPETSRSRRSWRGESTQTKLLAVDHDHASGAVRQLLCSFCNTGLGSFADDSDRLRKAADYLEKHRNVT